MAKRQLNKEKLSTITTMAISAGVVVASVLMMLVIFVGTILLIGIVLG
ncbi:hypothetical protein [Methylophilus luteus]|jgi:hypothetical protein|uniref:Uncharacterized protein n=1 Tax=Methylophilus luteus TaxID=640108 RepID=A0ABW3F6R1_9PROT